MLALDHFDRFGRHDWWSGFFGGILPFLFLLALLGIAVWAIARASSTARGPAPIPSSASRTDPALEEVRLRYARGEMNREEFVQRARDLGATGPELGQQAPPPTPA